MSEEPGKETVPPVAPPEEVWRRLAREAEAAESSVREWRVTPRVTAEQLRDRLEERFGDPGGRPLERVVAEVADLLRDGLTHVTSPRYFGLFNPSVTAAGIAGDALAALYNPQLAVWSHAPAAQEMEAWILERLGDRVGFGGDDVQAHFTSGGMEANYSAVLAALHQRFPDAGERGWAGVSGRPSVYVSEEAHHSVLKAARMAGIGTDAVRAVRVDDGFGLDPEALRERIAADRDDGWTPAVVVATAGTTGTGAIDPLPEVAEVADAFSAWYHVDAAWGGSAALSDRLRPLLDGVERADSLVWDAHKWLSVPMGAGMVFCRHPGALRRAFSTRTTYMPGDAHAVTAPYATTAQWSRRAIGLKVFLTGVTLGREGWAAMIERQARMGDRIREALRDAGWTVANDTPLPVVCFTHPRIRSGEATTGGVLDEIYDRGRVWISAVRPADGESLLRACVTSFRTDGSDVRCLVEELEAALAAAGADGG